MGKYALLIGIDTYGEGLQPLPAASKDVAALREVLLNPEMGGFDEAKPLINPTQPEMAREIELWFQDRQPEDLVLLFFSGHGVKDDRLDLYFAAHNTEQQRKRLVRSTAIPAHFIRDCIRRCKAKYQVIILDCCYSGAFGDLIPRDDGTINLKEQMGAEGHVVLTSTSAVDYSFEEKGADLSIYTRYLVEGIATGAADEDEDGVITVDELHYYAGRKVKETSPVMSPDIITLKGEGFRIRVARSPQNDPKLIYRKEVERRATAAELTIPARRILIMLRAELRLSDAEAEAIEAEVLQPHRERQSKLEEYYDVLRKCLEDERILSPKVIRDLIDLRDHLKLREEDVAPVELKLLNGRNLARYVAELESQQQEQVQQEMQAQQQTEAQRRQEQVEAEHKQQEAERRKQAAATDQDDLSSAKGINYTKLRELLKAQDWKGADLETNLRMLEVVGRSSTDWIRAEELQTFPCADLKTIDCLWIKYSNGHFGFSIQKKIWQECGSPTSSGKDWDRFCVRVGWKSSNPTDSVPYVPHWKLHKNLVKSPAGELPGAFWRDDFRAKSWLGRVWIGFSSLSQRLVECNQ